MKSVEAYSIYHEGQPFAGRYGVKGIYQRKGSAVGQVTRVSEYLAREVWEKQNPNKSWWDVSSDERSHLQKMYAEQHFAVMEYGPVKQVWPL